MAFRSARSRAGRGRMARPRDRGRAAHARIYVRLPRHVVSPLRRRLRRDPANRSRMERHRASGHCAADDSPRPCGTDSRNAHRFRAQRLDCRRIPRSRQSRRRRARAARLSYDARQVRCDLSQWIRTRLPRITGHPGGRRPAALHRARRPRVRARRCEPRI